MTPTPAIHCGSERDDTLVYVRMGGGAGDDTGGGHHESGAHGQTGGLELQLDVFIRHEERGQVGSEVFVGIRILGGHGVDGNGTLSVVLGRLGRVGLLGRVSGVIGVIGELRSLPAPPSPGVDPGLTIPRPHRTASVRPRVAISPIGPNHTMYIHPSGSGSGDRGSTSVATAAVVVGGHVVGVVREVGNRPLIAVADPAAINPCPSVSVRVSPRVATVAISP